MITVWKYEKPNYEMLFKKIDKLQKENKELKERIKNQYELINELEKCVTPKAAQKIFRKNLENKKELDNSISKDKIREYIKENKRVYEMQTPNRNRVVYKDCVLLTSEAKELLGE